MSELPTLPRVPDARDDDAEDVSWSLSTAAAMWSRGEHADAIKWVRRAAEAASEASLDVRALELAKAAADLAGALARESSVAAVDLHANGRDSTEPSDPNPRPSPPREAPAPAELQPPKPVTAPPRALLTQTPRPGLVTGSAPNSVAPRPGPTSQAPAAKRPLPPQGASVASHTPLPPRASQAPAASGKTHPATTAPSPARIANVASSMATADAPLTSSGTASPAVATGSADAQDALPAQPQQAPSDPPPTAKAPAATAILRAQIAERVTQPDTTAQWAPLDPVAVISALPSSEPRLIDGIPHAPGDHLPVDPIGNDDLARTNLVAVPVVARKGRGDSEPQLWGDERTRASHEPARVWRAEDAATVATRGLLATTAEHETHPTDANHATGGADAADAAVVRDEDAPELGPVATTPQEAGRGRVPEFVPQAIRQSQAVRVIVWKDAAGVHVAPHGSVVSAITVDAILVALDERADLSAWLGSLKKG